MTLQTAKKVADAAHKLGVRASILSPVAGNCYAPRNSNAVLLDTEDPEKINHINNELVLFFSRDKHHYSDMIDGISKFSNFYIAC